MRCKHDTDTVLSDSFGEHLKTLRKRKGLMLKDVSEKSKISITYLNRLENNKRKSPSLAVLRKLASGLEVSVMSLLEISLNIEEKETKTLREVLTDNNYRIGHRNIDIKSKELLADIIELIIKNDLESDNLEITYKVRLLKERI